MVLTGCGGYQHREWGASAEPPAGSPLQQLRRGQSVRLVAGGVRRSALFARLRHDSLVMTLDGRETVLAVSSVDSLWVRQDQGLTGAVTGGLMVGALFAVGLARLSRQEGGDAKPAGLLMAGAAGFTIGSFIGGVLGSAGSAWRQLVPGT